MTAAFEQFVVFGTDNAGLERLLRLFQAISLVLTSYPTLVTLLLSSSPPAHIAAAVASATASLLHLQARINITRRMLRFFRFLDFFQSGWGLYLRDPQSAEAWLDVLGSSCLGVFGMLESATLLDLLHIDHLEIFGAKQTVRLNHQAQLFWIVALYTSILSSGIKLLRLLAYRGVPKTGAGFGTGEKVVKNEVADGEDAGKAGAAQAEKNAVVEARLRHRSERKDEMKESNAQAWALGLKLIADALDLVLPTTAVGWIKVDSGLVGIAMTCTSIITAAQVWTRCGREVQRRHGK